MIASLLLAAAPLLLAAIGGLLSELAGSLAVFLEGFMNLGGFVAWTAARATGSAALGTAAAALLAAGLGALLALFVRASGADPFIVALAANLASSGITDALSAAWFGTKGVVSDPGALARLPGPAPFIVLSWACALGAWAFLARTPAGLRLRAAGASPAVAAERGIDPRRYRTAAWAAAAALAALGGAALAFRVGAFAPGGVAGRGWIALAAVFLGFRDARGVAAAALVFAAAEQAASAAQGGSFLPPTIALAIPPAIALGLFVFSRAAYAKRESVRK